MDGNPTQLRDLRNPPNLVIQSSRKKNSDWGATMDQPVRDLPTGTWAAGLTRVPYWVYRDPALARDEQVRLFEGPAWHFLCLEVDVAEPGDYRTTMMGAMPVVVARTEDGAVVGFENRCAHRGALICLDDGGKAKDFQCVYTPFMREPENPNRIKRR